MVTAMLEDNLCSPAILPHNILGILQTPKTFHVNDIRCGRLAKNAVYFIISKVWTCNS